jgi:hypothetical protein
MSNESLTHIEDPRRLLFRETFADEQSVRRNGGTPTDVTFSNGKGALNGTSSYIRYPTISFSGKSATFRMILEFNEVGIVYLLPGDANRADIKGYAYTAADLSNIIIKSGVYNISLDFLSPLSANTKYEIVITRNAITAVYRLYLDGVLQDGGARADELIYWSSFGERYNGGIDGAHTWELFEIYNYALTDEEISNLYEGKRFHELVGVHDEQVSDVVNSIDFSDGGVWTSPVNVSASGILTFTTSSGGGVRQTGKTLFTAGTRYKLTLAGTSGASAFSIRNYGGGVYYTITPSGGTFSDESIITAIDDGIYIRNNDAATTTFTTYQIEEILVEETSEILNVSAQLGSIVDRWGNTLTNTATVVHRDGDVMAMLFDGSTSKVDCGDIDVHTSDRTFVVWHKPYSFGEGGGGRLFDNGKLIIYVREASSGYGMFTDGITLRVSGSNAIEVNKWQMLVVTMTSGGIINYYVNTVQNGSPNLVCGTPVDGSTNLIIGNNNAVSSTFDGLISDARIYEGLLSATEISQLFSNERSKYRI